MSQGGSCRDFRFGQTDDESSSRREAARTATKQASLSGAADFCFGPFVSWEAASTQLDACAVSAQTASAGESRWSCVETECRSRPV